MGDDGTDPLLALMREAARAPERALAEALPGPGSRVGRFLLGRELGRGAYGVVYEASDTGLERRVAVKVVRASGDEALARFRREAAMAARLNHPNVVTIHDHGMAGGAAFVVLELLQGRTLAERLEDGPLPTERALSILVDVARGLAAAHAAGIVHRDLKPGNVFVTDDGRVKLLDFGLAFALGGAGPSPHSISAGTPAYMSPEQWRGEPQDARSDVFSAGIMLYRLLAGQTPWRFAGERPGALLDGEPPPPLPGGAGPLAAVAARALAFAPEERYPDGAALLAALLAAREALLARRVADGLASTLGSGDGPRPAGHVLAPGEVLAGRYRVVRFLAAGGMGEVYEAEDLVLRKQVALKTLHAGQTGDGRARERLLREILMAHRVSHPNVCRIIDAGTHGELTFLSMELLEGETLAARLREGGAMTAAQALPLVEQLAAALEAAHAAGVIHRDLKGQNIFLVPSPRREVRLVVTDFGLARPDDEDAPSASSLGEGGGMVGTPATMSPEQVAGLGVTPASDIYAMGVVIYEMVTGRLPFEADSAQQLAVMRLGQPPVPPRARVAGLDARWEAAILRCLALRPQDRFASAGEVVAALRAPRPARKAPVMSIALALAAAALVTTRPPPPRSPPPPPPPAIAGRPSVAVLSFKNLSGKAEVAWLATALPELLDAELAAGEAIRTIPGEDVARARIELELPDSDTLGRDTLERVGRDLGARYVVAGSYLALASEGSLQVTLRLQDTATGETLASVSESGTGSDLPGLVARGGEGLRLRLGVASDGERAVPAAALPRDPGAARLYAEGLARARAFDPRGARARLEEAVAIEPGSALIHNLLGAVSFQQGDEAGAAAQAKLAFEQSKDLSRELHLYLEAVHRIYAGEWPRAVAILRELCGYFPDEEEYAANLIVSLGLAGDVRGARATAATMRATIPALAASRSLAFAERRTFLLAADWPGALETALRDEVLAAAQGARLPFASARLDEGIARYHLGDFDRSETALTEAARIAEALGYRGAAQQARYWLGGILYSREQLHRSLRNADELVAGARALGNPYSGWQYGQIRALILMQLGDLGAAAIQLEDVCAEKTYFSPLAEGACKTHRAHLHMLRGELDAARAASERALEVAEKAGDGLDLGLARTIHGMVLMAQDDLAGARADFEKLRGGANAVWATPSLARLELEAGRPDRAEAALAAPGAPPLDLTSRTSTLTLRAWALLEQGKLPEARAAVSDVVMLLTIVESAVTRLDARIVAARVLAREDPAAALAALALVREEAARRGMVPFVLAARLWTADIGVRAGDRGARAAARALARDARARGSLLIARKAEALAR